MRYAALGRNAFPEGNIQRDAAMGRRLHGQIITIPCRSNQRIFPMPAGHFRWATIRALVAEVTVQLFSAWGICT